MNISGTVACVFLLNILENNWYFDSNWPKTGSGEMGYRFIYKKYMNIRTQLNDSLEFWRTTPLFRQNYIFFEEERD